MRDLLSIEELSVAFELGGRSIPVLREVSLQVQSGGFVGLVGESGSGKSLLALSVLRLLPPTAKVVSGRVIFEGQDLLELSTTDLRAIRGGRIGMVFQEPMTALNPVYTIGFQVAEALRAHRKLNRDQARAEVERLLEMVAISPAGSRYEDYPHQLSGGQRQRVVLAMALAAEPALLIADEPTSALDVSIQAEILQLLEELRARLGLAILFITHDLAAAAGTCEQVYVMYAGQIVESARTVDLFQATGHPYTRGLLASIPRLGSPQGRGEMISIPGQAPALGEFPRGCSFHPRCSEAVARCSEEEPSMVPGQGRSQARCLLLEASGGGVGESE